MASFTTLIWWVERHRPAMDNQFDTSCKLVLSSSAGVAIKLCLILDSSCFIKDLCGRHDTRAYTLFGNCHGSQDRLSLLFIMVSWSRASRMSITGHFASDF